MAYERCGHCGSQFGFGAKMTGEPPLHLRCAQYLAARDGAPASHPLNDPATGHHPASHRDDKR